MLLAKTNHYREIPKYLKQIEEKWKPILDNNFKKIKIIDGTKKNDSKPRYILSMFPYPSGSLHLGHVRIYTSSDIITRFSRLQCNGSSSSGGVINPMGFDSYGLPAENAARERGIDPALWISSNIETMKKQMSDLSFQFDWRESTSDANFYKWTQQLFTRLMRSNLVYKTYAQVNWDPIDKTVLADEQVDEEGRSWRSGAKIERRNHHQWFIKTNSFCNDIYLAEDVNRDYWQDIIDIQKNWIGKPNGWLFYLPIEYKPELLLDSGTSLVISDDHWLTSFDNINLGIANPFTGERMNVKVLDKEEDKSLLPNNTKATIAKEDTDIVRDPSRLELKSENRDRILRLATLGKFGGYFTSDKYRDWLISRQRYWGTPIPVTNCPECSHQPIKDEDLPVKLPPIGNIKQLQEERKHHPSNNFITSPLKEFGPKDWLETKCSNCGSNATRETDTCDTLFDSSWYYLRYATEPSIKSAFDKEFVQPVWCYVGGKEHAAMHLFYARFITHFLHSQKLLPYREPFERLLVQGVVKSRTYKLGGRYLSQLEMQKMRELNHPDLLKITEDYEKMSKSKGNGIDPKDLLNEYGIDATRFCLMSYVNPDTERLWRSNDEEFKDTLIFLRRIALTFQDLENIDTIKNINDENPDEKAISELRRDRNRYVWFCTHHLQNTYKFRQYISCLHSLFNHLRKHATTRLALTEEYSNAMESFIIMLNPIAPHFSEELWSLFKRYRKMNFRVEHDNSLRSLVCQQPWPEFDADFPLSINITTNKARQSLDIIPIDQERFHKLSKEDIYELAHDHLVSRGYKFSISEVEIFPGIMSRVTVNIIEDKNIKTDKKNKKFKKNKNKANVD